MATINTRVSIIVRVYRTDEQGNRELVQEIKLGEPKEGKQ